MVFQLIFLNAYSTSILIKKVSIEFVNLLANNKIISINETFVSAIIFFNEIGILIFKWK